MRALTYPSAKDVRVVTMPRFVSARSQRVQTLVEGRAVLIGRKGHVFQEVLKSHHIPLCGVERAFREAHCDQKNMRYAFQEADGQISTLKDSGDA